jgi:hypothetical protein
LDGSIRSIAAVNGKYALTLPAAHCDDPNYGCAIGGTPIILVEDAPARMEAASPIDAATATPGPSSAATSSTPPNIDLPIGAIVIGLGIELVLVSVALRRRTPRHVSGRK